MNIKRINILNSVVDLISVEKLHDCINSFIENNQKAIIGNINIHAVNLAYNHKWYANFIKGCPIVFCDGKGIQLGAWLLGHTVPTQITYHTWMWQLLAFCNKYNYSLFFLGSKNGVAQQAIKYIKEKHKDLELHSHHGYFEKKGKENNIVIEQINKIKPDILIVGFGMPMQEKWISDNYNNLNAKIFLNGGAFLEWLSGNQKQCPPFLTKIGMEWLYRLILEPRRLFKRYVYGNPVFLFRIICFRIKQYFGLINE